MDQTTGRRHGTEAGRRRSGWGLARVLAPALAMLLGGAASGAAGETQWWILDRAADYSKSESRGVVVRPDGVLELGPAASSSADDSLTTIWAVAVLADGSVALAGDRGRIDRWTEGGGIRPWVRLPVGQVLSLAADGPGLVAGTAPEGVLYRIGAKGDTSTMARTGERYVWGVASGGKGVWYAATGTRGRLYRIEGGRPRLVLDSDESNLVSLIGDGKGGVYTGGDSKGRIVHVRGDGSVRTVFDAPEDEVRALAIGADKALYAAALSASAVASREETEEDEKTPSVSPVRAAVSAAKATVYRIVPDSSAVPWWSSPQPFVFALAGTPSGVVAATGNRAGIYRLERSGGTQLLAASQGQITALASDAKGRLYAASSNPAALWRVGPGKAERGELLSPVLDAHRIARFGRIRWRGSAGGGRVELYARSGNTDTPDTTWSSWQGGAVGLEGVRIPSPPARYLQWKIELAGGNPDVESVEAAWREQNLPPVLDELVIAPQGQGFREGEMLPRSEPVTQTLPGGQKIEYSIPPATNPRALRDLPMWARGMRTVQWKGSDPNGDPLRYRVEARIEDGAWIELGDDLEASAFTWDTNALPDGRYRLRVIATDQPVNPVGEERTTELLSEPFTIDNTPPNVTAFEAHGEAAAVRVEARAEDGMSTLTRMEVAIDDGDWRTVTPETGFADERELSIRALLPKLKPGEHTVSVRAVDFAGNAATRARRVTVSGPR